MKKQPTDEVRGGERSDPWMQLLAAVEHHLEYNSAGLTNRNMAAAAMAVREVLKKEEVTNG